MMGSHLFVFMSTGVHKLGAEILQGAMAGDGADPERGMGPKPKHRCPESRPGPSCCDKFMKGGPLETYDYQANKKLPCIHACT